jgi:hypothetical protein
MLGNAELEVALASHSLSHMLTLHNEKLPNLYGVRSDFQVIYPLCASVFSFFFFVALGFELRAFTLSHSTSPFL